MSPSRRRTLLTVVLFAGVLSIGPFISPMPDGDVVSAATIEGRDGATFGGAADVVGGELTDGTGVPEPGTPGWRLLAVAVLILGLGVVVPAAGCRPIERRSLRIRPVVTLLPNRRGPPTVAV